MVVDLKIDHQPAIDPIKSEKDRIVVVLT